MELGNWVKSERIGQIEIILAMLLAGSTIPAGKLLTGQYSVFFIGMATMVFALVLLIPLQVLRLGEISIIEKRALGGMVLQALFGIVLFRIFSLLGLRYTSAFNGGIITSMGPVVMALLASVFLGERLNPRGIVAILLGVGGLLWINLPSMGRGDSLSPLGNILVLLAVVSEVMLTLFRKSTGGNISALTNTTVLCLISLVLFSIPQLLLGEWPEFSSVPPRDWIIMVYYGSVATVVAYLLWGDGAMRIPAQQTGLFSACVPLSAMALSMIMLGEKPLLSQLWGAILVLLGLILTLFSSIKGRRVL